MLSMFSHPLTVAFTQVGFDHLIKESGVSDKVREWLGREPQRLAFQVALAGAYNTFAGQHPEWAATLFDEHFLKNRAAPLLLRCLPPADRPDPAELAAAWAKQFDLTDTEREERTILLTPVASDFLRLFENELRARPEFKPLFDSRALKTIEQGTTQTAEAVEKLREELNQALNVLIALHVHSITPMEERSHNQQSLPMSPPALPSGVSLIAPPADNRKQEPSAALRPTPPATELKRSPEQAPERPTNHPKRKNEPFLWTIWRKVWNFLVEILLLGRTEPQNPGDFDWLYQLKPPIGAVDDQFYVTRDADTEFKRLIRQEGPPIIIRGARQTGKTSLLAQGIIHAREHNLKVVHLDLQAVGQTHLQAYDHFLRYLAESIVSELELDLNLVQKAWSSPHRSAPDKLSRLLRRDILPKSDNPIILALDEADYLLKFDFRADFFGLLRSWHNRAATDPRWGKLNMVLVISTEPHLLIADPYQSPFNVGKYIDLKDFSKEQLRDLAQRYRLPLQESEMGQLMALLNGHPYLTHQALYTLATESCSWAELADLAMSDDGPFASHLRRYYALLRTQSDLQAALKQVIHKQSCPKEAFHRLKRAGLVRGHDKQAIFRCRLYQKYFEETL